MTGLTLTRTRNPRMKLKNRVACVMISYLLLPAVLFSAKTPIQAGAEINYPPFSMADSSGQAEGFSVELLRESLRAMNRDVTFRTGEWNDVRAWLEKGEVQILPLVGRTPEREPLFDFTFPYMTLHGAIVVRQGNRQIKKLADLHGHDVVVMAGDNAEEFLRRKDRGIRIHTTPTFKDALMQLSQGRYDAAVIQRLVALRLVQKYKLVNLKIIEKPVHEFRQDFCFAVQEGDRETLALLNEGLSIIMANDTFRHLHAKWFAVLQLPENRRIVVEGDNNFPPFEFLDENGEPAGYNVDLTRAIARATGLNIEIRLGPWSDIRRDMEEGKIDALQGMFYSLERDSKLDFSPAHTVTHMVSVVRKDDAPPPETLEALRNLHIVVQNGDIMHDFVREHKLGSRITAVEAQQDALQALSDGSYDCALVSRVTALYWIGQRNMNNLIVGRQPLLEFQYCYAVPNSQKALLAVFSEGLRVLEESGEYQRIKQKWLGIYQDKPRSIFNILRISAMFLIPLSVILLAVFLWSWSLRKKVARRTAELRKNLEFQRAMFACSPVALFSIDHQGTVQEWNTSAERIFGWTADEIIGKFLPIVPQDKQQEFTNLRRKVLQDRSFSNIHVIRQRKNGDQFHASLSAAPIYDPQKRIIGIMASLEDISKRIRAEQRIEHLNRVLLAVRDVNQLIVRERDPDTLIRKACQLLVNNRGYTSALIIRTDEYDKPITWAEAGADNESSFQQLLENGRLPGCCEQARRSKGVILSPPHVRDNLLSVKDNSELLCASLRHKDSQLGYMSVKVGHELGVDPEEQQLFQDMVSDIAYALYVLKMDAAREKIEHDHKILQKQMMQTQKMEAVGRLAGGVAHDYKNMLSVIIGYTEMALDKTLDETLRSDLSEVLKAAQHSTEITRQLLAFARKQTIRPEVLDLNATVESMLKMLRHLIGENIELGWQPKAGLWPVKIDPVQVDQILANLCVNSRDAIASVGRIAIETDNATIDADSFPEHEEIIQGDYVMMAVSDTGCGMDARTRDNIFEPFFTTKNAEQGTGLGLSTVYGIVKQNAGFIHVYSEPGEGTTFRIYLPRHSGNLSEKNGTDQDKLYQGNGETILLVEDEPTIMQLSRKILQKFNYHVLYSESPENALKLAGHYNGAIDLLLTDVIMPEMNGRDLAEKIIKLYPDIKVLYMSGYTANSIAHHGVLNDDVEFLAKPFTPRNLAEKIRQTLDKD